MKYAEEGKRWVVEALYFLPLHHQTWQSYQAPQLQPVLGWDLGSTALYNIPIQGEFMFISLVVITFMDL